jgi:histidine kinase
VPLPEEDSVLSKRNLFRIKFAVAVFAVFAVAMVGYGFYRAESKDILKTLHGDTTVLSDTIKQAFRLHMVEGRREKTQSLLDTISGLASIERIRVYDREGEIRFSTVPEEVGFQGDRSDPTCMICHAEGAAGRNVTVDYTTADGRTVLRNVNPLENDQVCRRCHSRDEELLGVLMVDVSTQSARRVLEDLRWATFFLLVSITMVFGILIFMNQVFDFFKVD